MRKFTLLLVLGFCVLRVSAQTPSFLGTKTPYVVPEGKYTEAPAGYRPVFVNYVGRHGARFMTKAGPDLEALKLLDAASAQGGLTAVGVRVKGMVRRLCELEKGQYENITLLGAEEQQAIGQRMLSRYGAAFSGKGLEVEVTYKIRTEQSADAFLKGFGGYKGPRRFLKRPDSTDAVLRFYDLSPAYQQYKKSAVLKAAFDSLERDQRVGAAASAVCERVFTAAFRGGLKAAEELRFERDLYDLYSVQFSMVRETKDSIDLGIAFGKPELEWEDFVSGAQDFMEKGPARAALGIQTKVAAPLLEDFIRTTDGIAGGNADAVLRFTHAEAISPFATLLGIPEASVAVPDIYSYAKCWQAARVIPLSANIQWIVYSDGKGYLVKVLLNEREVVLPLNRVGGVFYKWEDLRAYCRQRLEAVGAGRTGNMLVYLRELR